MLKKNRRFYMKKRILTCALTAGIALSVTACGNQNYGHHEKGVANPDTSQTQFAIMGAQGALSPGYDDNVVLNQLQQEAGISIDWTTMKESLAEQVNIRIAGGELPDAFMGVGFSNYDISRYGDDGTFIDLTPYLTARSLWMMAISMVSRRESAWGRRESARRRITVFTLSRSFP